MKKIIFIITMIMTTQSFAAKCILTGQVNEGESCSKITTRLDVGDLSACADFAKSTESNKFFGLVENDHKLIATEYSFSSGTKTQETIVHDETLSCD